jgi:sorbitol/mannitol transport system permease protein
MTMTSMAHETSSEPRLRSRSALLLFPSVIVLLLWMIVPLAMTLWFSGERYNLLDSRTISFIGFSNYRELLTHPALWISMGNTIFLVGLVLIITLVFGTLFSLLLDLDFPGRNICRLLVISPFFVMPTVGALIWKNMLMNPVFGLFAWLTNSLGFGAIDFFSRAPLLSIVLIVAWEWTPFAVLILLPALQSLNPEQVEAAKIDGADRFALFRYLQLPHLLRPMAVVAMIEMIFFLSLFAEIYVTTGGGPGLDSTNLAYLIFREALLGWDVGRASAAGVIAIILANAVSFFLMRVVGRNLAEKS